MLTRFLYPVDLIPQDDGGFVVIFPDIPEALTEGDDRADALAEASDCLAEALAGRIRSKKKFPTPSPAHDRPLVGPDPVIAAKAALYQTLAEAGITQVELGRRMGVSEVEVRRLLDPRHNSKIGRLDGALAALGKRVILEVRDVA